MAAEGNNIVRYLYRGGEGESIPREATHITVIARAILKRAFFRHRNIQELICDASVEKIEEEAFFWCPYLRRVIMPGVKEVERGAFNICEALTYVECGKLEIIGEEAFETCDSLSSVNLPSIKIVESLAFNGCRNLTNAKFGKDLESIGNGAFEGCPALERIALPLKDELMTHDDIFRFCKKLNHVDLVEGTILHEAAAALLLEEWKNDMSHAICSINQNLASAPAGHAYDVGGKAQAIQTWIRSVLRKIVHYKAEHQRILDEAATTLHHVLPNDIVLDSILSFLELPSYTFEGEEEEESSDDQSDDDEDMEEE